MTYFRDFYPQVLRTLKSNTLVSMTDEELESFLDDLTIRAIADFRFPKISLSYTTDVDGNYQFDNDITQNEINVLLVLIKRNWLEMQLDDESKYDMIFIDRDVKTFSQGNLVGKLNQRYELAKKDVKSAQYNYSRISSSGAPMLGELHDE